MDIVEKSNRTLHRLEQNDPKLKSLHIVGRDNTAGHTAKGCFWVHDEADLSKLGNAIGNNEHLSVISFHESSEWTLDSRPLFEGLQRNTTITNLTLYGSIGIGVLNEYVANISSLTRIGIINCDLRSGVVGTLASAMHIFPNLNIIAIFKCTIDGASLKEFAIGIRGLSCLQELHFLSNEDPTTGGIEGAEAIATLVQDPSCNLTDLHLSDCGFSNDSIQIVVNSLMGNTKLETLNLSFNKIERSGCESIATLLQDPRCCLTHLNLGSCGFKNELTSIIVDGLSGNAKLEQLDFSYNRIGRSGCESIATLLQEPNSNINKINLSKCKIDNDCSTLLAQALIGNNKLNYLDLARNPSITESGWNAFSTILSNCSNTTLCSFGDDDDGKDVAPGNLASLLKLNRAVEIEPLFDLDSEEDERKPKALPNVIDWFGRIGGSTQDEEVVKCIEARKLSAIYQFARAMTLEFIPSPSDILLLHKEARDRLIKAKEELEAKDEIIQHRCGISDSIDSLPKKRKHGE